MPWRGVAMQAIKEIYAQDAAKAKAMAAERKKNGSIEMSAAKMATMMDEAGGGESGGDVPMVKVRLDGGNLIPFDLANNHDGIRG